MLTSPESSVSTLSPLSSAPPSPEGSVADEAGKGLVPPPLVAATTQSASTEKFGEGNIEKESGDGDYGQWYEGGIDPYADVRARMEALLRRQRRHHASSVDGTPESKAAAEAEEKELSLPPYSSFDPHRDITVFAAITTYLGYVVLILIGHVRDVCAGLFRKGRYRRNDGEVQRDRHGGVGEGMAGAVTNANANANAVDFKSDASRSTCPSDDPTRYAPLLKSWENFYTRRLYHRIQDCFNRPIASRPSAIMSVLERVSYDGNKTLSVLDADGATRVGFVPGPHGTETEDKRRTRQCLNLGSYNYLGFADDWDATCRKDVMRSLDNLPPSTLSPRAECGTTSLHREVERTVSTFVGKEDAAVLNMGFNVNAAAIPALVSNGDLLVSDELNHTSIVNGARASGAAIRTFRHDDPSDLESILREAIAYGQPRTRRPWNRVLVVVEGIYSMEGERCNLAGIVKACKKYGAYVYLDEAHSIGAVGKTGRGLCEYAGVDPKDVDVCMGTFTKSFGGMGGYVAADKEVVDHLRRECAGYSYHNSLSPVVCQQILSSFRVIMGEDGTPTGRRKLDALRDNSNYFRMRLTDMGLHVLGHYDSPIIPVMLYNPTKIAAFSRECLKRGLAVVVVGFPAVPILMSRARFCVSAGHTREQLDRALVELEEIADLLKLRYARSTFG